MLFEGTLDGLFVVNAETGRIVLANRTGAKMFGFDSPEAMIGVDPIDFFTSKDRNGVLKFVAEDVLRDLSEEGLHSDRKVREIRVITNDGREIWLEIQGTPTEYQGRLAYLVSNRDITERKQAEEEIQSLAKFPSENPYPVLRVAKDGKVLYSNKAALELLAEWKIKIGEKVPGRWCRLIEESFESGKPISEEEEVKDKIFSLEIALIKESGYVNLYGHDITERKKAEGALWESEQKYRNLFNTAEVALFRSRIADGKILECNDLLAKLFGYDSREQCMAEHVTSEHYVDHSVRAQILTQMLENGKVENFEAQVTRRDGSTFWVSYSAHIYPERNFIEGAIVDITERKRMEEALRESEQTIRRLAKASASAHEEERQRVSLEVHDRISQTLTGAFHQLQALESIPMENTGAQQILKRASALLQQSIGESRNIIEDLYSPVLSDFGIVAVIDEELRRFREETGCGTKFDKKFAVRPIPDVELTAYRIFREVIANIKRHAIGATEVRVSLSCEAGVVSLQVKDNGPGFDVKAAMLNKRVGGLKGMQRRAELGGGTFEVVSSRGHGTTVTVRLPYSSEAPAADVGKEEKTT